MHFVKAFLIFSCFSIQFLQAQSKIQHDIFVTSAAVQHLYRNCANKVNIEVPDLCNDYHLICTATNADIQQSCDFKRKFIIVPQGDTCTLSVYNLQGKDTILLGKIPFNVIEPPKPTIEVLLNGQKINENTEVRRNEIFSVKIIPDPEFALNMPQDAQYSIDYITFFVHYSPRGVGKVDASNLDIKNGISIPVPSEAFQCQRGSRLHMQIVNLYRINYKGERIRETMTIAEQYVSLITGL